MCRTGASQNTERKSHPLISSCENTSFCSDVPDRGAGRGEGPLRSLKAEPHTYCSVQSHIFYKYVMIVFQGKEL